MNFQPQLEALSSQISVCVTPQHRFGTDAFLLADFAAPRHKDMVCDLGTGCGIIPFLMIKNNQPKQIYAVDIQPQAIEQLNYALRHSAAESGVGRIIPLCMDLKELTARQVPLGSFDLVTCNPPYKAEHAGILSEGQAEQIARHEIFCTLEDICFVASRMLKFGGRLCICQRPERLADAMEAMRRAGIEPKRLRLVAKHHHSAPWLFLLEGKKGSKPFMRVLPILAVYSEDGKQFSSEMKHIYHWEKSNSEQL